MRVQMAIAGLAAWALAALAHPMSAQAMTFEAVQVRHDGRPMQAVRARGPIEEGDAARFVRIAETLTTEPRVLVVESPGGNVRAAMALAEEIRARGYSVMVDGRCASACSSILFPAGEYAVLRPGALLGFHSCHQAGFEHLTRRCNHAVARLAAENGFPYATLRHLMDPHGPREINWISRITATCFGYYRDFGAPVPKETSPPCVSAMRRLDAPVSHPGSGSCVTGGTPIAEPECRNRELAFLDGLLKGLVRKTGASLPDDRRVAFQARQEAWRQALDRSCAQGGRNPESDPDACLSRGIQDRLLALADISGDAEARASQPYN